MMRIRTLIIGAGNISAFYDSPADDKVLTHAHAIVTNNNFDLIGFVDIDFNKAKEAAIIWGGRAYNSLDEVDEKLDLICIAVPDKYHYQVAEATINRHPRVIVLEKPLTIELDEGRKLVDLIKKEKIHAEVNYSRRFVYGFSRLKEEVLNLGRFLGGTVLYGKGLIHNGSHMVNLLLFLLGDMRLISCLGTVDDYLPDDSSREVIYAIGDGHVVFQPVDSRLVTTFEFDLRFSKGRVKYDGSKEQIMLYEIRESDIYTGELNYVLRRELNISSSEAMGNLYIHISKVFHNDVKIVSSVNDAYKTLQLCK